MKPITILCAYCLRPLAKELGRVKERTETCVRQHPIVRHVWPSGQVVLQIDSDAAMECSTWVVEP